MDVKVIVLLCVSFLVTLLALQLRRGSTGTTELTALPRRQQVQLNSAFLSPSSSSSSSVCAGTDSQRSITTSSKEDDDDFQQTAIDIDVRLPNDFFDFASSDRFNLDLDFTLPISKRKRTRSSRWRSPCTTRLGLGDGGEEDKTDMWMKNCGIVILATSPAAVKDIKNIDRAASLRLLIQQFRQSEWSEPFPIQVLIPVEIEGYLEILREALSAFPRVELACVTSDTRSSSSRNNQRRPVLFNFSLVVDSRLVLAGPRAANPVYLLDLLWHYDIIHVQLSTVSGRLNHAVSSTLLNQSADDEMLDFLQLPNPFVFAMRNSACFYDGMLPLLLVSETNKRRRGSWVAWLHTARAIRKLLLRTCRNGKSTFMADYFAMLTTAREAKGASAVYQNNVVL